MQPADKSFVDYGIPGASAGREHAKRRANREQRALGKHERTAHSQHALPGIPHHETAWESGSIGEQLLAGALEKRCNENVLLLHDRQIPESRTNIDHIGVCPTGIWVIDAKNYKGKVEICELLPGQASLRIGGRYQTKLVDNLIKQVDVVRNALADQPAISVHGAIGFVGNGLAIGEKLSFKGCPVLRPRELAERLNQDGPLGIDEIHRLTELLAERFQRA
jgi:hypothetical protein